MAAREALRSDRGGSRSSSVDARSSSPRAVYIGRRKSSRYAGTTWSAVRSHWPGRPGSCSSSVSYLAAGDGPGPDRGEKGVGRCRAIGIAARIDVPVAGRQLAGGTVRLWADRNDRVVPAPLTQTDAVVISATAGIEPQRSLGSGRAGAAVAPGPRRRTRSAPSPSGRDRHTRHNRCAGRTTCATPGQECDPPRRPLRSARVAQPRRDPVHRLQQRPVQVAVGVGRLAALREQFHLQVV